MEPRAWRALLPGLQLAALVLVQAGSPASALGADAAPKFGEEMTKQESIYRSRGEKVPGGYVTGRALTDYVELLPSGFTESLKALGPSDRWLDIGAGRGQAILDYYEPQFGRDPGSAPRGKAQVVAVSIEDRRGDQWHQRAAAVGEDRLRYLYSKRLREYSREELGGRFRMITDVYGGFSYTDNLSMFLEKVLSLLEVQGDFYTMLQSIHTSDGKDSPRTWYLTELVDKSGRDVKVCDYLKRISCVQVTCEPRSAWEAPTELIRVHKVCNKTAVPPLNPLFFEAGNPPGRRFETKP